MALTTFLHGVRNGGMLISPGVSADQPLNAANIENQLRRCDLWLTPKTVDGFNVNDFTFLTKEERAALEKNVAKFRQVAMAVPSDGPATRQQVSEASEPFREIYETVKGLFDREFLKVRAAIEKLFANRSFPDFVVAFDLRVENDSTGDPAVWVWLIVEDSADEEQVHRAIHPAQQLIADHFERNGIDRFVYLSVRTVTEQREWLNGMYE